MLQIAKNGGEGLHKGNLFTTASPCELCSKKAFQLGIKNIFFIDLYPGISKNHILEGGMKKKNNPNLYQYQGVIGRGYQKLYEPFMSIKDETVLRSKIKPSEDIKQKIKNLTKDKQQLELIEKILKDKDFREKASKI
jgi:deoxycytidylate deaminase